MQESVPVLFCRCSRSIITSKYCLKPETNMAHGRVRSRCFSAQQRCSTCFSTQQQLSTALFNLLDTDKNGLIDAIEFVSAMACASGEFCCCLYVRGRCMYMFETYGLATRAAKLCCDKGAALTVLLLSRPHPRSQAWTQEGYGL